MCVQTVRVHYQQNVHCRTLVANHCRRSSGWLYEILQLDATSGHATLSPHPAHRRPHLGTDRARRINGAEFRLTASADYSSAPGGPHRADRQSVGPLKITPPPPPPTNAPVLRLSGTARHDERPHGRTVLLNIARRQLVYCVVCPRPGFITPPSFASWDQTTMGKARHNLVRGRRT